MTFLKLLIFCSFISLIYSFRRYRNPKQIRETTTKASRKNILSLDDTINLSSQSYEKPPATLLLISAIFTLILVGVYIYQSKPRAVHTMNCSYEELAAWWTGDFLAKQSNRKNQEVLVIKSSNSDNDQFWISMLENFNDGIDLNLTIVGNESVLLNEKENASSSINFNETFMTVEDLIPILNNYPTVDIIVSFVGFAAAADQLEQLKTIKDLYFIVVDNKANLYRYLEMINTGIVDLAIISKGAYSYRTIIPKDIVPQKIIEQNFLIVSLTNVREIAGDYRQYIGKFPLNKNDFFNQK